MPIRGPLAHVDLSVSNPDHSIPFYDAFFTALGYRRLDISHPAFQGFKPSRAFYADPDGVKLEVAFIPEENS